MFNDISTKPRKKHFDPEFRKLINVTVSLGASAIVAIGVTYWLAFNNDSFDLNTKSMILAAGFGLVVMTMLVSVAINYSPRRVWIVVVVIAILAAAVWLLWFVMGLAVHTTVN